MGKLREWANSKKSNMFVKYFILFAIIFLFCLGILGVSLVLLVNIYWQEKNTSLLEKNTHSICTTMQSICTMDDMNTDYSIGKEVVCETLSILSNSVEADIFVCDVEGNVILCKENAGAHAAYGKFPTCVKHQNLIVQSRLLQKVYEGGTTTRGVISSKEYYIVGEPIKSHNEIIGSVFAISPTGTGDLVREIFEMFLLCALFCLAIGYICIYFLTKRMLSPLQQMSKAAKQFSQGDFSYRVKIKGSDELVDLAQSFNNMADSLDKLESSRSNFVANVSHELRTPMTSIAGFIDGILDGTIPKEKEKYYLGIVSDEIRRLSRLVVAMLNLSKIDSGDFDLKPHHYDISDQIIHILLTFEQKIESKHIEIRGLDSFVPTTVFADTDMIYQVVYNLIDNAVKFTNEGGYIELRINSFSDCIEVHIKNSGLGIKADELSKIFERFYKVDKSRSLDAKGAGLGLYIVKTMVEMHGGKIYAKSENENTAEFVFTLPKDKNKL